MEALAHQILSPADLADLQQQLSRNMTSAKVPPEVLMSETEPYAVPLPENLAQAEGSWDVYR